MDFNIGIFSTNGPTKTSKSFDHIIVMMKNIDLSY